MRVSTAGTGGRGLNASAWGDDGADQPLRGAAGRDREVPLSHRQAIWRQSHEVGVVATEINYDDYVDAILDSGVKIIETAGRSPEPFMERFQAAGAKVIHKCVAVRHAHFPQAHRR